MPRRSYPTTDLVEQTISEAVEAAIAAHEAVRSAQQRVAASYRYVRGLENEKVVAAKFVAVSDRLHTARYTTNVAAMRLRAMLDLVRLRGSRRQRTPG